MNPWVALPLLVVDSSITLYFLIRCHQVRTEQARCAARESRELKASAEKAHKEQHGNQAEYQEPLYF